MYVSNCCSAPILSGDLCAECKEHCEAIEETEDENPPKEHSTTASAVALYTTDSGSTPDVPTNIQSKQVWRKKKFKKWKNV